MNTDTSIQPPVDANATAVVAQYDGLINSWLQEAAELRKLMNSAKTQTKKAYFEKKFKKLSKDIISAVASKEFVKQMAAAEKKEEQDVSPDAKIS